ncbi:PEP/pyruvate-binding domain-containing protein [Nigerium massiliense]|uniref:PEP/pyruvate-binding domain-containing protein n=1 Tax=Nigerium massiliense TaxID=1522317 RepID=UPI001C43B6AD|nr:PEP/pyruvate-binding domain-containing protein [Nigerium massiliense]
MSITVELSALRRGDRAVAGGKGANLGELVAGGFDVPPGFVVTTDAYHRFVTEAGIADQIVRAATDWEPAEAERLASRLIEDAPLPAELEDAIAAAYRALGDAVPVAVRSSATAEDLGAASFAGQQESFLNVRGEEALVDAVRRCWASVWGERAIEYRRHAGVAASDVAMAVVVQQMVDADASGVMFTANPDNGRLEQVVINAAFGLGESVVGGSVTPDTLVVEPAAGRVVGRSTATKSVWTRPLASGTVEEPLAEDRRGAAVLSDDEALELAGLGVRVQEHAGAPQDIEWARAAGRFWLVQSRPITSLPPRVGDVPTQWPIDDPSGLYARASIIEQLPDPLSPLFADLAPSSVIGALESLFSTLGGGEKYEGGGFPIINGYPYYYYPRRLLLKLLRRTPVMLGMLAGRRKRFDPAQNWREKALPEYRFISSAWAGRDLAAVPTAELIDGLRDLLDAGCRYYTAVQTVMPFVSMNDVLFENAYTRLARRPGDPEATTFLVGFDSEPIRADKALHDLATWVRAQPALANALRAGGSLDGVPGEVREAWRRRLDAYLAEFGHATANLDFMAPVPADDPVPVLDGVRFYLDSDADPAARQRRLATAREDATRALLARLDPARRALLGRLVRAAQRDAPVREDALAAQGLAWPVMRRICRELGRRLVAGRVIEAADDVYWLHADELTSTDDLRDRVEQRKATWRGQRRATPSQLLPEQAWRRWLGRFMPARQDAAADGPIRGTASSGGRVTATARVVGGPADFGALNPGEVLVAAITTPAYTPLFARASAVVTDVGGPLSHSSIVAREYGIPAVLGTAVATSRIHSGDTVTVDGERGVVTIDGAAAG